MTTRSWIRNLFARPGARCLHQEPRRARLVVETLEERTVLSTGLVGYWQANNNTTDSAGNVNGSLVGGAGYAAGQYGQAFNLNGSNSIALSGSVNGPLNITGAGLTVAAWVNLNTYSSPNSNQAIFDKYFSGGFNGYMLGVANSGHLTGFLSTTVTGASFFSVDGGVPVGVNTWAFVAMTYDGATARLYLNGVQTASVPLTGNITPNGFDARIGNDNGGATTYGLNGRIDNLSVWNRALSASELVALAAADNDASLMVTTAQDVVDPADGVSSLREAILLANSTPGADTITFSRLFSSPQTITLTGGPLTLTDAATTTIAGPGMGLLSVSGNNVSRVFVIDPSASASLSELTITKGQAPSFPGGAGLYNHGTATLTNCAITDNSAFFGGGVTNRGSLTFDGCIIANNTAFAGAGGGLYQQRGASTTLRGCTISGNIAISASGDGGGIYSGGLLNASDSVFTENQAQGGSRGGAIGVYGYGAATLTNCIVSGNWARNGAGIQCDGIRGASLVMTGCTVSGNWATVSGGGSGGGIGVGGNASATLTNCTVSGNTASNRGGGLFTGAGGTTALTDCTVSGNSSGGQGGGLGNYGGTTTLTDCIVSVNSSGSNGGGLWNRTGTTTLTHSTVSDNTANRGGGLFSFIGAVTLTACTVSGNDAMDAGGGVVNYAAMTLTHCTVSDNTAKFAAGLISFNGATQLVNSTVSGNSATFHGGGVWVQGPSTVSLTNCTVSGNSAANLGGGLICVGGSTTLTNSTVSGNSAASVGGGLICLGGTTALTSSTVSANSANFAGGVFQQAPGTATLTNTIVAGQTAGGSIEGAVTGSNNLIGTGNSGGLVNGVNGNIVGVANPLLAPLGNYGGPTKTMPLLPGSLAINAGTAAGAPGTDQRGFGRVGAVDIGAFESSGFTLAVTSGSSQATDIFQPFAAPLAVTVSPNNPSEPVAGGQVTFTSPTSGASATLSGNPAVISATGIASVTADANGFGGTYVVSATANGTTTPAIFNLANRPTIHVPANAQTAYEDVDQAISGISIGDAPTATVTVTLTVSSGTLTLGATTGLTTVSGLGTGSVTLIGSTADLNAALATLMYRGILNSSGLDTLHITATDSGASATPARVDINVISAAQQAAHLQGLVSALLAEGVLNQGQANSLIVKLNLQGNMGDVEKVQAFLNEVQALLSAGILSQEEAGELSYWGNLLLLSVARR